MAYQTRTAWGLDHRGEDWRDRAECRPGNSVNPEWFFNEGRGPDVDRFNNAARTVCFSCPVKDDCLAYAMGAGVTDGIFGGLTPDERKALRTGVRMRTMCRKDLHPMEGDNLGWRTEGRYCRACRSEVQRTYREKRAGAMS